MFEAHFSPDLLSESEPASNDLPLTLTQNNKSSQPSNQLFAKDVQHPIYNCKIWLWNAFGKRESTANATQLHEFVHLEYKTKTNETATIFVESSIKNTTTNMIINQILTQPLPGISPEKSDKWLDSLQNARN